MKNDTKLTIALPVYNSESSILGAIESCKNIPLDSHVNIRMEDIEILVLDNCSTDKTAEIIKKSSSKIPSLRLIQNKKNLGRIGNWNEAIRKAKGKYLIFLFNNDRIPTENGISRQINLMEQDVSIGMTMSRFRMIDQGKPSIIDRTIKHDSVVDAKEYIKNKISWHHFIFSPLQANIYRTSQAKKVKFMDDRNITADQIFTIQYASQFRKINLSTSVQLDWILAKGRFHLAASPFAGLMEENKIIDEDSIRKIINKQMFIDKAYLKALYFRYSGKISKPEYSKLISQIRNLASQNKCKSGFSFRFIMSLLGKTLP
ncbi:glycosyltransferase family 2 protein [Candidatus Woesearchaeota archaeon]|nr:glycosyltransferase family 2 protein [Candidatus Woesearchaeota archaeon]